MSDGTCLRLLETESELFHLKTVEPFRQIVIEGGKAPEVAAELENVTSRGANRAIEGDGAVA